MAYEIKAGNGTLFKNDSYTQGGTHPYCKGKFKDPTGKEWEAALWLPKSDKIKGFNITIKEPYNPNATQDNVYKAITETAQDADGLPF